jgi:hypothetical protein
MIKIQEESCKEHPNPNCPFCNYFIVWKHASYIRTGTYSKILKNPPDEKKVQRCKCQRPGCGMTFGVLPSETLPYCRFDFNDFLYIHSQCCQGMSAYAIHKACQLQQVSLAAIKRLLVLFKRVMRFIKNWCSEIDEPVTENLNAMCLSLLGKRSWFAFTSRWYHALYPARLWPGENPHNL